MREIKIKAVLNGYQVRVGCQDLVFNSLHSMTIELQRYLNNPDQVEKEYLENSINARFMRPEGPCVAPAHTADEACCGGQQTEAPAAPPMPQGQLTRDPAPPVPYPGQVRSAPMGAFGER